ncbi:ECF-type sigma factor [Paenibacillus woosongensis]|uniref:RNA polymerase sigma-70 ECF-like HTH domain-containing protein n=1 Tax=Paenibacillus woosongensis TaxID=307580 RepID=A0ABQ4MPR9_9BACL|nr:ECF-type sigma factor [Paenibacillus woosongensis]GIP57894.1 hypothetical protein J15TS10_17080 [Paenibacillus woosongensis]
MQTAEQRAIEQLSQYRQKQARIQVLSTYSVGAGITVSRLNEDDQLQELHARLRRLPSYMYLSKREQQLELVANAYMDTFPSGIVAQKRAVPLNVPDEEDRKLLQELRRKIQKVIEARGYDVRDDIEAVLDRLAELQDLQTEVNRVDFLLETLRGYRPNDAYLLRLIYVEGMNNAEIAEISQVTERTIDRRRKTAESEYIKLAR